MASTSIVKHHHAHHVANAGQEFSSAKLGMWLFLVTELLLFGGLFVGYTILKGRYPEMWHEASGHLNWQLGAVNTLVLITSSFTMALAVNAAQTNKNGEKNARMFGLLLATILLAGAFLVVKYFEYSHKFHEGMLPGAHYAYTQIAAPNAHLFFGIYFLMTGLHGFHVVVGICLLTWILLRARKGHFYSEYYTPVEVGGLYWHLVDLIWIYLFPLLYLVG